ncbi:monocarboxylate transporter 4-like [Gigantopelta aegis]|uniref:monocarboxylate transporter 4-like n=1 Tax=Gigantopelta aegis TaxID=1735272 RepID=UPI001B88A4A5|nr:monocarboxylate transporter 4-like [Gigantopelta aegis]
MPSKLRYVVLAACFLVNFIVIGFAVGLGVIFVELVNLFGTSRAQMAFMQSLCGGLIFAGALISSPFVRRFGTTTCCLVGGFMSTVSVMAASFLSSIPGLISLIGVVAGFSLSFCHLVSYVTIRQVFCDRAGFGEAVIMAGGGLGAFCMPMINTFLLEEFGWRGTFLLLSGLLFNICLLGIVTHTFKRLCLQSDRCDKDVDVHSENGRKEEQTQYMDGQFEHYVGETSCSVLPALCIICKKKDLCVTVGHKRVKDKLIQAETESAGQLREAATQKCDETILLHIRDKDCVAIEDVVYLASNGRRQTPKSLALGLTVQHLIGSCQLLDILNRFGHCASLLVMRQAWPNSNLRQVETFPKVLKSKHPL